MCLEGKPQACRQQAALRRPVPGLSMTRAFGDGLAATVGVIADPELTEFHLGVHDKYLILCRWAYLRLHCHRGTSILQWQGLAGWHRISRPEPACTQQAACPTAGLMPVVC